MHPSHRTAVRNAAVGAQVHRHPRMFTEIRQMELGRHVGPL
jgi:hypothetical protein